MTPKLLAAMSAAIDELKRWPQKNVQLFHHNDTDGLTSGALLTCAFERQGYTVERYCLEKPYPKLLKKVFQQEGALIVLTDFAGRIAPLISDLNKGRNLTLIIDHHKAFPATDPMVHNLDPELFGMQGDRDITASVTCYLFAVTLDPANRDLSFIASMGAVGDQFYEAGRLVGNNRDVVQETVAQGLMEIRTHAGGEKYYFQTNRGLLSGETVWTYLDTLGAAGFYQGGPDMGIRVCLDGFSEASDRMLKKLRKIQNNAFEAEIARIKSDGLQVTDHIQWFRVNKRFQPMGVKMIGAFLDIYKDTEVFDPTKYMAGFMVIPNEVPGFGALRLDEVKVSMRASKQLEGKIRSGKALGLDTFMPEATDRLGGFSDACHSLAAATTVEIGKEARLVAEMENILSSQHPVHHPTVY